jgi:hypothetical protein
MCKSITYDTEGCFRVKNTNVFPGPICIINMQQVFVTIRKLYIPFENKRNSDGDITEARSLSHYH